MSNHHDNEILDTLMNVNLKQKPNKELVKLITDQEGDEIEDEVTSQLILLARKLQRNKITKAQVLHLNPKVSDAIYYDNLSARRSVKFHRALYTHGAPIYMFTMDVDSNDTVNQLIEKVQTRIHGTVSNLKYDGRLMHPEKLLKNAYFLKNGDSIVYTTHDLY